MAKRWYTIDAAAKKLGVGRSSVRYAIKAGKVVFRVNPDPDAEVRYYVDPATYEPKRGRNKACEACGRVMDVRARAEAKFFEDWVRRMRAATRAGSPLDSRTHPRRVRCKMCKTIISDAKSRRVRS